MEKVSTLQQWYQLAQMRLITEGAIVCFEQEEEAQMSLCHDMVGEALYLLRNYLIELQDTLRQETAERTAQIKAQRGEA